MHIHEDHVSLGRDFGKQDCPAELHGMIDTLRAVRQRILTNTFLKGLTKWWTWILAALIVIAALSAKLAAAMILPGYWASLAEQFHSRLDLPDAAFHL